MTNEERQLESLYLVAATLPSPNRGNTTVLESEENSNFSFENFVASIYSHRTALNERTTSSYTDNTLTSEFLSFKRIHQPELVNSSLNWASSEISSAFPILRHLILHIHACPFTSVSAEQCFSTAKYQTDSLSSTLNDYDYETRLIVSYNLRHLSVQNFFMMQGWNTWYNLLNRHETVVDTINQNSNVVVGANNRRTGEKGRAQIVANRNLRRQSPESDTIDISPFERTPSYRRRRTNFRHTNVPIEFNSGDSDIENFSSSPLASTLIQEIQPGSEFRQQVVCKLSELLETLNPMHSVPLAIQVRKLKFIINSLQLGASMRKELLNLIPKYVMLSFIRFTQALKQYVEEQTEWRDLLLLLRADQSWQRDMVLTNNDEQRSIVIFDDPLESQMADNAQESSQLFDQPGVETPLAMAIAQSLEMENSEAENRRYQRKALENILQENRLL